VTATRARFTTVVRRSLPPPVRSRGHDHDGGDRSPAAGRGPGGGGRRGRLGDEEQPSGERIRSTDSRYRSRTRRCHRHGVGRGQGSGRQAVEDGHEPGERNGQHHQGSVNSKASAMATNAPVPRIDPRPVMTAPPSPSSRASSLTTRARGRPAGHREGAGGRGGRAGRRPGARERPPASMGESSSRLRREAGLEAAASRSRPSVRAEGIGSRRIPTSPSGACRLGWKVSPLSIAHSRPVPTSRSTWPILRSALLATMSKTAKGHSSGRG
jgi:hypothetical protein